MIPASSVLVDTIVVPDFENEMKCVNFLQSALTFFLKLTHFFHFFFKEHNFSRLYYNYVSYFSLIPVFNQ